jgi:hypothetical protein
MYIYDRQSGMQDQRTAQPITVRPSQLYYHRAPAGRTRESIERTLGAFEALQEPSTGSVTNGQFGTTLSRLGIPHNAHSAPFSALLKPF